MRSALLAFALLLPAPAFAGGLGLFATGGLHGDRVFYYQPDPEGNLVQADPVTQTNPNFGGGLELILGDRDNRIQGIFRGYFLQDGPQNDSFSTKDTDVFNIRTAPRNIGVIAGGIQWGLFGEPTGLQLVLDTTVGSGFLTQDFSEFVTVDAQVGGTYMINRKVQLHAEVGGGVRYRLRVTHAESLSLGVRYIFD